MDNKQSSLLKLEVMYMCKRVFEEYYKFIPLNLSQGNKGVYILRSSEERNMFLLFAHIYYFDYGMKRKKGIF